MVGTKIYLKVPADRKLRKIKCFPRNRLKLGTGVLGINYINILNKKLHRIQ